MNLVDVNPFDELVLLIPESVKFSAGQFIKLLYFRTIQGIFTNDSVFTCQVNEFYGILL